MRLRDAKEKMPVREHRETRLLRKELSLTDEVAEELRLRLRKKGIGLETFLDAGKEAQREEIRQAKVVVGQRKAKQKKLAATTGENGATKAGLLDTLRDGPTDVIRDDKGAPVAFAMPASVAALANGLTVQHLFHARDFVNKCGSSRTAQTALAELVRLQISDTILVSEQPNSSEGQDRDPRRAYVAPGEWGPLYGPAGNGS